MNGRFVVLRVQIEDDSSAVQWISETLGEAARELEAHEADGKLPRLGLVPDPDEPGRYTWDITERTERYV